MLSALRKKYELGKYILTREGLLPFIEAAFLFPLRLLANYENLYIYELPLTEQRAEGLAPAANNFKFETISTGQQLRELTARGFDIGIHFVSAEERLNKGAVMFCVFVGKELAHIRWVAATAEAKDSIVEIPCRVDFSNGEVYLGWSETVPRYRRKGLLVYTYFEIAKYLRKDGRTKVRAIVEKSNTASRNAHAKLGGRICVEGRYLRLLWWKFWREKPFISE